jgi:cytochrome c oxidase subunit 2
VVADAEYLKEAITNPGAQIPQGFQNGMPPFNLDEESLNNLVKYIETLK